MFHLIKYFQDSSASETESFEEEIEPKLKYERLLNDIQSILLKSSATCIAVHHKVLFIHYSFSNVNNNASFFSVYSSRFTLGCNSFIRPPRHKHRKEGNKSTYSCSKPNLRRQKRRIYCYMLRRWKRSHTRAVH